MFFFQRFRRSMSNKNRLGQKFKIPVAYVFLYDHFASVHAFWCKSDKNPRTSSRKCVKMPNFDLLFDLCDLDLDHMTLSFAPGRSVTQYQYILQVSWKSDDGKGAKRVWRLDVRTSVQLITYIHKIWNVASNQESINLVYPNSKNQFRNESQMCARPGNVLKHLLPLENPLIMDETHKY